METLTVSRELATIRERTAKLILASVVVHIGIGAFVLTRDPGSPADDSIDYQVTEITWLDPVSPVVPLVTTMIETAAAPASRKTDSADAADTSPVVLPAPGERAQAIADRLASLRGNQTARRVVADAAAAEPALKRSSLLAAFVPGAGRQAVDLARSSKENVAPAAATPAPIRRAAIAVAEVAQAAVAAPSETKREQERTQEISPGVSLAGPVSDRALLSFGTPTYPEWAKRDGVEVTVALYFTVLPNGRVKENVLIEKTSGYLDFDQRARSSLLSWRFETLGDGATSEQWGRIEFNYRLKQAG